MEDTESPPAPLNHVLRPHHVGILAAILLAYRRDVHPSPLFMLHIQRVLIEEISEVSYPRPYNELVQALTTRYLATSPEVLSLERALTLVPKHLNNIDAIHDFFADIQNLVIDKDEEADVHVALFDRRSYFGLFCRRCCISYYKLSIAGVDRLQYDFARWTQGDNLAGYEIQETYRKGTGHLLFPTAADEKDFGTASFFKSFQSAVAEGDTPESMEYLRLFFDQQFSDSTESGFRQHALLNLALLHFNNGEHPAAKKFLLEAITVARTSSDRATLQHCMSLLRRFTSQEASSMLPLTEIQPGTSATYVVSDVIKLVIQSKEPILSSFCRVFQAWACFDASFDGQGATSADYEQWNIHAAQSFLWKISGPEHLSASEESIILMFTHQGCAKEARWDALRSRAQRLSRQGQTAKAIAILLDPNCWNILNLRQYNEWAGVVWQLMVTQVIRRGQLRQFHEFFRDRIPNINFDTYNAFTKIPPPPKNLSFFPLLDRDAILHAKRHYKDRDTLAAIQFLLRGLFAAEFRGHWPMYRIGIILLADLAGDLGMRQYGKRTLEEIMPQIMAGDDIELRAFGCYILARCIVSSNNGNDLIHNAIPFLEVAEKDYASLEMITCQQDVLYLLASIYNTLGRLENRDYISSRHADCVTKAEKWVKEEMQPEVIALWTIVTEIGAKIAAGSEIRSSV